MGFPNVRVLRRFVAATQQQDYLRSVLAVINTISGAEMDPQFVDTCADTVMIAKVSILDAVNTLEYGGSPYAILEIIEPISENILSARDIVDYFSWVRLHEIRGNCIP